MNRLSNKILNIGKKYKKADKRTRQIVGQYMILKKKNK